MLYVNLIQKACDPIQYMVDLRTWKQTKTVLAFPVIVYLNTMNDRKSFLEVLYTSTKVFWS